MCIMASEVSHVSDTRIFVGRHRNNLDRQITVYEMQVKLRDGTGNAMILPVPASATSIELIDLSAHRDFFAVLYGLFVQRLRTLEVIDANFIEVKRVGDYNVSIASDPSDISRINPDVFTLSAATRDVLARNYGVGFSFVVAQLRKSGAQHPLAYTFPRTATALFVPTRHEHGHRDEGAAAYWDHDIYHQGTLSHVPSSPFHRQGKVERRRPNQYNLRGRLPDTVATYVDHTRPFERLRVAGEFPNIDLSITS